MHGRYGRRCVPGRIAPLALDIAGMDSMRSVQLRRADAWAFWRRFRPCRIFVKVNIA